MSYLDRVLDTTHINMLDYDSRGRNCCTPSGDMIPIAALSPVLPELDSKKFKATVVLIWPYSPSASHFALLLADPDMRLRHNNGHVRVRFSGSSAKAVAATGVTIGDEMMISLQGATLTKQEMNKTLGENIAWELSYTDTVVLQALRNGNSFANLDIVHTAHVADLQSLSSPDVVAVDSSVTQRPIPGFLEKRKISYEFRPETDNDLLVYEIDETECQKRQGKVYRDP
jgi:hypothetical protein